MNSKKTIFYMTKWIIFQFGDVIKVAGVDIDTKKFRISSKITNFVNEIRTSSLHGPVASCILFSSSGNTYVVSGFPVNVSMSNVICDEITKHVFKRVNNTNWSDVSFIADTTFFDGDFV